MESANGYANVDDILAVEGLHAIAFGSFDPDFSLGLSSDYFISLGVVPALLDAGRAFVAQHREDTFSSQ